MKQHREVSTEKNAKKKYFEKGKSRIRRMIGLAAIIELFPCVTTTKGNWIETKEQAEQTT